MIAVNEGSGDANFKKGMMQLFENGYKDYIKNKNAMERHLSANICVKVFISQGY